MLTLIDNYDSFTYNLVHFLGELGAQCRVYRNDKVSVDQVLEENPQAIILSPGPCTPNEAGICLDLVKRAAEGEVPLLGVCLGHQAIGQAFGGDIVRAPTLMHGKLSTVRNTGAGIFTGLPPEFEATRYHSLTVKRETLPDCLEITAETDGVIMGLQHKKLPLHGVQFHPESIASQHGHALLANFLDIAGIKHEPAGPFDAAMAVM
jgi:anthranilate synthase component 2